MLEKKHAENGYPNQGWVWNARVAKRVSKSRKIWENGYPNHYDQSSSHAIIRGKGR